MTAEIVNLNKVRKARERANREREAEENRMKFGQSKAERGLFDAQSRKSQMDLDRARRQNEHHIDDDDQDPGPKAS
ncbi:DUF4169 domain-containing protein [Hyphomicrobium methylovorum]|uniref:DUF4169 family protein n=1 Tax=Hyphomicrobium methylovorum TaxID=84 RepID=UPI0015E6FC6D|nr:DUF4169 family protein [Hyphomicrobium methylovorum]MBA2126578.1 DUF4169 domain-containing protein [Hyphomicrobium methylovorum]